MKKLVLITTGGTISSVYDPQKGYAPALGAEKLLGGKPLPIADTKVEVIPFAAILSFAMTPEMILRLVELAEEKAAQQDVSGVVISQGTAMLEESPYLADLFWQSDKPLVFTGAMLNGSESDWDGPRNIRNALITAASEEARGKGVLVCLGGEIHAAKEVLKTHKTSLSPLCSVNAGPLGLIVNDKAVIYRAPLKRISFAQKRVEPAVEIVKVAMGSSGVLVDALIKAGIRAIVLEALPGGGGVSQSIFDAVKRNRDKAVFIMCPRSPGGIAFSKAGGGIGPVDQRAIGVLSAGSLTSVKARIFLMAALPQVKDREELAELLYQTSM